MDFEGLQPPSRHGVYVENAGEHDANGIPRARERTGPFWQWVGGMLGLPAPKSAILDSDERDGRPFMLTSVGTYSPFMSDDERLAAMRRREAAIAALNGPKPPTPLQAIAGDVLDMVREALGNVAKASKLTEARLWVAKTLAPGAMKATRLEKLAKSAGIAPRTLRRALKALKVQRSRNRDKTTTLSLIQAEPGGGQES
jgi:hypothetical protein